MQSHGVPPYHGELNLKPDTASTYGGESLQSKDLSDTQSQEIKTEDECIHQTAVKQIYDHSESSEESEEKNISIFEDILKSRTPNDSLELSETSSSSSSEHVKESDEEVKKQSKKRNKKHSSPGKHYETINMQIGSQKKIIHKKTEHYSEGRKKSSKEKHKTAGFQTEKLKINGSGPISYPNRENRCPITNREIIVNAAKSVGIIRGPGTAGTGFIVNDNFVMTTFQVVKRFLNGNGDLQDHCLQQLSIQFDYKESHLLNAQNKTFLFEQKVAYQNEDLDTAVLQIKVDLNKIMPDALSVFGEVHDPFCLIGHPEGDVLQDDSQLYVWPRNQEAMNQVRNWSIEKFGRDGYQGIERESRVLFHTSFAHGASGAPAIHIDEISGTGVVTAMLVRGYPDFYYTGELNQEELNEITNEHRIEEGITMKYICKAMKESGHSDLSFQIFGHFFDGIN